jgi:hypothetical protein
MIGEAVVAEGGLSGEIARRFINGRLKNVISCGRGNPADTRDPVLTMIKASRNVPMLEIPGRSRGGRCGDAHAKRSDHYAKRDCFAKIGHESSPISVTKN